MLIPSIDLAGGKAVQLRRGKELVITSDRDPRELAVEFGRVGEIAVIDLDAAMGKGGNAGLIEAVLAEAPARVGGGIRDLATATRWLDAGAARIIIGTAAKPDLLARLPRQRVIAALDARHGEVVVEGWKTGTGAKILDRIAELMRWNQLSLRKMSCPAKKVTRGKSLATARHSSSSSDTTSVPMPRRKVAGTPWACMSST